jgi:hypothetical protein
MSFEIEKYTWSNELVDSRNENERYKSFKNKKGMHLTEILAREVPQNTNDVRLPNKIAKLKITYRDDCNKDYVKAIREPLRERLKQLNTDYQSNNSSALIIEEFGTEGLTGGMDIGVDSNFNNFHFNSGQQHGEGKQSKLGKSNGGAGLGSIILHIVSNDDVVLTLSSRSDDDREYLVGKASWQQHPGKETSGQKKGWYKKNEAFLPHDIKQTRKPIEDQKVLKEFIDEFKLERQLGAQNYGVSFVILNPIEALKDNKKLIEAILKNYFVPIMDGLLELEINGVIINQKEVLDLIDPYIGIKEKDYYTFLAEAITLSKVNLTLDSDYFQKSPTGKLTLKFPEEKYQQKDLDDLQDKFDKKEVIHIRAPVEIIQIKDDKGKKLKPPKKYKNYISVFLQKDKKNSESYNQMLRDELIIKNEGRPLKVGGNKLFAMTRITEDEIARFLRTCEEPSHSDFRAKYGREFYSSVSETIFCVREVATMIAEHLQKPSDNMADFVKNFIMSPISGSGNDMYVKPIPTPTPTSPNPNPPTSGNPTTQPTPPTPRLMLYEIENETNGFYIHEGNDLITSFPKTLELKFGYEGTGINGISSYNPCDFRIEHLNLTSHNIIILKRQFNELIIQITGPIFNCKITGWNPDRAIICDHLIK